VDEILVVSTILGSYRGKVVFFSTNTIDQCRIYDTTAPLHFIHSIIQLLKELKGDIERMPWTWQR
jgi:hypothetical protein